MSSLRISTLREARSSDHVQLAATVRDETAAHEIWFRTAPGPVGALADPFVPAVLFPAMRTASSMCVDAPVSAAILRSAQRVQQVKAVWDPSLRIVPIEAEHAVTPARETRGAVGAFFSGGVDSFYTLKKHRGLITHLIFVHGFDIPLQRQGLYEDVVVELRRVARGLGLEILEVQTNVRSFGGQYVSWDDYHGAAMAAVAHFLSSRFAKIFIPSSFAYAFLFPYGSHPGLDPLWGSESIELVHDGCEAGRFEKIEALAAWDVAVRNLRVCWQLVEGKRNCCLCRKCLWTMAFLRACGALEHAGGFEQPLDLMALRQHPPRRADEQARFVQALAAVERRGDDPELAECLREGLERGRASSPARSLVGRLGGSVRRLWPGKRR